MILKCLNSKSILFYRVVKFNLASTLFIKINKQHSIFFHNTHHSGASWSKSKVYNYTKKHLSYFRVIIWLKLNKIDSIYLIKKYINEIFNNFFLRYAYTNSHYFNYATNRCISKIIKYFI